MIGHFPVPYPDELLYSLCARFSDHVRYPTLGMVSLELLGATMATAIVGLPGRLEHLVANLPPGYPATVETFIDHHTLLPFYAPFLPATNLRRLYADMRATNGSGMQGRASATTGGLLMPDRLRFCPLCVEADQQQFGECYWHRVHQVAGVEVCPTHAVWLEPSDARIRYRTSGRAFVSAECARRVVSPRPLDRSDACHQRLLELARDAEWLLQHPNSRMDLATIQKQYVVALIQRKLASPHGLLHVAEVWHAFKAYYPSNLFHMLRCNLDERLSHQWQSFLVHDSRKLYHPMYHLLMIHFLGYSLPEFLCGDLPTEYRPFGEAPWPCLNPVSDHCRQLVIRECRWVNDFFQHRIEGTFACPLCGFAYTRWGPEQCPEDRFRSQRVRTYGPVWEAELRRLWNEPNVNLRHIARQLGVGYDRMMEYAARLDLPVPRPGNPKSRVVPKPARLLGPSLPISYQVEDYRARWLIHLKEHPAANRKELRNANLSVSRWLRRYDPDWLKLNLPPRRVPQVRPRKANWEERDRQFVTDVEQAATFIRNMPGNPVQVTKTAISREVGRLTWLYDYLEVLPLSAAALAKVTETYDEFALRKIEWVVEQYRQEQIYPTRSDLMERAHLYHLAQHPQVQTALDAALHRLYQLETGLLRPDA
jgi:hypothetical protein